MIQFFKRFHHECSGQMVISLPGGSREECDNPCQIRPEAYGKRSPSSDSPMLIELILSTPRFYLLDFNQPANCYKQHIKRKKEEADCTPQCRRVVSTQSYQIRRTKRRRVAICSKAKCARGMTPAEYGTEKG